MRTVQGDLAEVFEWYAALGQVAVIADRLVLSLQQFGRLAADTHVRQTNRVLSLVEDAFYALSDRGRESEADAASTRALKPFSSWPA
ncbi:hypothetical protein MNEG_15698 [Monoraphidium neglectum]|uniref:Uncharacterized protein n=1 Tax=Monoraphidium neglectum TaxID=145388 RepID=A0A0D2MA60_9CHLO|nr:hypothetical protein MNEG_15698 [Monoraphidium neglectum]KIY92265.1 hypothetical protein MNEG_15698 [Monoraphidium neglectum]|eukprot:XP_013891285.1 hypothetical protein MNEG_15698 [Monoraphidium neglectum]